MDKAKRWHGVAWLPTVSRPPRRKAEIVGSKAKNLQHKRWRPGAESNRRSGICSPVHYHFATQPSKKQREVSLQRERNRI